MQELTAESNAAALAALASIHPSLDVDKATSDQVWEMGETY